MCARCSAAPTTSRSRSTGPAPRGASISGAAPQCTSRAAHDRIPGFAMIDFELNDEHRLLEQTIREWGAQNITPFIRENDRTHHFDRERVLGGMAKMGLL